MRKWLLGFLALLVSAAVQAQSAPDALVKQVTEEVRTLIKQDKDLQTGNPSKIYKLVEDKVFPHLNFSRTTQLAMGKNWRDASAEQKEQLMNEFRSLLVRTYATSLAQFKDQNIDYKPLKAQASDSEVLVATEVKQSGGQSIGLDYRMNKTPNGWKVFDISVDGVSLVTTYRGEFNERIRQGGIDGLIKALADKNKAAQGT